MNIGDIENLKISVKKGGRESGISRSLIQFFRFLLSKNYRIVKMRGREIEFVDLHWLGRLLDEFAVNYHANNLRFFEYSAENGSAKHVVCARSEEEAKYSPFLCRKMKTFNDIDRNKVLLRSMSAKEIKTRVKLNLCPWCRPCTAVLRKMSRCLTL